MFMYETSQQTFEGRCWLLVGLCGRGGKRWRSRRIYFLCLYINLNHGPGNSCRDLYLCSYLIFIYLPLNLREMGVDVSL